jgi:hypothetical protein
MTGDGQRVIKLSFACPCFSLFCRRGWSCSVVWSESESAPSRSTSMPGSFIIQHPRIRDILVSMLAESEWAPSRSAHSRFPLAGVCRWDHRVAPSHSLNNLYFPPFNHFSLSKSFTSKFTCLFHGFRPPPQPHTAPLASPCIEGSPSKHTYQISRIRRC